MSDEAAGAWIEVRELATVGAFLAAMVPGFWWVSRAKDQPRIYARIAVVGAVLLGAAVLEGLRERRKQDQ